MRRNTQDRRSTSGTFSPTPLGLKPGAKKKMQDKLTSQRRRAERTIIGKGIGVIVDIDTYEDMDFPPTPADKHNLGRSRDLTKLAS